MAGRGISEPASSADGLPSGAVLFGSSGSSGAEKWVVHTRESLLCSARAVNALLAVTAEDVFGVLLPFYHVGGVGLYARAYAAEAQCVTMDARWSPRAAVLFLETHNVTIISLVPTQVYDLVEAGLVAPSSLRVVVVGGGSLEIELGQRARDLGWPVLQSYGMSEAGSQVATASLDSLDVPYTNDRLSVLPIWELEASSQLTLSGPALCVGILTSEGYHPHNQFLVQDHVEVVDGELTFYGRVDRMVKVLGELVNLDALERAVCEAVDTKVLIVPQEDERAGASLHGFSETMVHEDEIQAVFPSYAKLRSFHQIEKFPTSALGKLDRRALVGYLKSI